MIAAMANLLGYDIYDLELTAVKNNKELRKLLTETSRKPITVIEDIYCTLDLTGQRRDKKCKNDEAGDEKFKDPKAKPAKEEKEVKASQVTLSGLLNFIHGLWSACGGERSIVFTTNYVEKLDPALIRKGRMDKHIELSYCGFEAFKVLAKNYLKLESHRRLEQIQELLGEVRMTPADLAEHLMPKTGSGDLEASLENLIRGLESAKGEARRVAESEADEKGNKVEEEYLVP